MSYVVPGLAETGLELVNEKVLNLSRSLLEICIDFYSLKNDSRIEQ